MQKTFFRIGPVALVAALALTAGAAHAQRASRDAAGAPLRDASAAEAASLEAAKTARPVGMITGVANPRPVKYANGTVGQELDTSSMMYTVARRNPDGTISQYCVHGDEAATHLVNTKAPVQFANKFGKEQAYAVK